MGETGDERIKKIGIKDRTARQERTEKIGKNGEQ